MTKQPRLILRTCQPGMTSHGGFQWPTEGKVEAPDWNPRPECGGGLHGLLNGQGDARLLDWSPGAVWVVARPGRLMVDIGGQKVKCKTATVVYAGDRAGALAVLRANRVTDPLPGDVATAGDRGQATAGYYGQATAGRYGQATAGRYGQATAGYYGQATAGYYGQATAGRYGQATAGRYGQATAGYRGVIAIHWHDGRRYRLAVGYVGEDGIQPNVTYRVDKAGRFVEVTS